MGWPLKARYYVKYQNVTVFDRLTRKVHIVQTDDLYI